jgi:hypothetical protein
MHGSWQKSKESEASQAPFFLMRAIAEAVPDSFCRTPLTIGDFPPHLNLHQRQMEAARSLSKGIEIRTGKVFLEIPKGL